MGKRATPAPVPIVPTGRPSALLDTRGVCGFGFWGDNLEQLAKLPDASVCDRCVDLIYIDPPFNSNRNYEVFWGEMKEKRAFEDRHASTQAYMEYMRPRCEWTWCEEDVIVRKTCAQQLQLIPTSNRKCGI